jgi:hypothetical protein
VTTTMKPLPEPEVIPPSGSANYPEAAADRWDAQPSSTLEIGVFKLTGSGVEENIFVFKIH